MILSLKDINGKPLDDELILAKKGFWIFGNRKEWQKHLEDLAFGC